MQTRRFHNDLLSLCHLSKYLNFCSFTYFISSGKCLFIYLFICLFKNRKLEFQRITLDLSKNILTFLKIL